MAAPQDIVRNAVCQIINKKEGKPYTESLGLFNNLAFPCLYTPRRERRHIRGLNLFTVLVERQSYAGIPKSVRCQDPMILASGKCNYLISNLCSTMPSGVLASGFINDTDRTFSVTVTHV